MWFGLILTLSSSRFILFGCIKTILYIVVYRCVDELLAGITHIMVSFQTFGVWKWVDTIKISQSVGWLHVELWYWVEYKSLIIGHFPDNNSPSWFNKVVSIQTYVGWQLYVGLLNYGIEFSRYRCDTTALLIIFYVLFLFCLFILFISKCNCKIINRHFYLNLVNDIISITIKKN